MALTETHQGGPPPEGATPPTGVAALGLPGRILAAVALALVAGLACVHLGVVFLHVAPANTLSKRHAQAVDDWIYPEFEQNWKLFAPNPLQQNIAVQVRAEIRTGDGDARTVDWTDLSAEDGRAIDGNPAPSHTQQNELRRAWDFYVSSHDDENRATGPRGRLAEEYLRRIVVMRLGRTYEAEVERIQIRSRTLQVAPPVWSGEKAESEPRYRVLPWWNVSADDVPGGDL
ncbi:MULTISPECIES: DUF5819 family protein [Streptomyces]|uniref:DUF5819 family protein n=1 Tax=Streptomyces chilikensis TaxID=1194079 RepID=A0ABV3ETS2_9ACTN|nr:DUF5819 family protein [Streptomyces sp. MJP52]MDH6225989.1 hypothetical protein [Streptomyces sp. MJP52]